MSPSLHLSLYDSHHLSLYTCPSVHNPHSELLLFPFFYIDCSVADKHVGIAGCVVVDLVNLLKFFVSLSSLPPGIRVVN